MKKKSCFSFLLAVVIFFSFGSRVFGTTISTVKFLGEFEKGPVNFAIGDRVYEVKIREVGDLSVGYSYQFVSGTGWIDDKSFFNGNSCLVLLPSDNETGGKNIVESTDIEVTDEYTLSSCDCYDESGQKTKHYDGSLEMLKQVMCHYKCCKINKEYGYQWGANKRPSTIIESCSPAH